MTKQEWSARLSSFVSPLSVLWSGGAVPLRKLLFWATLDSMSTCFDLFLPVVVPLLKDFFSFLFLQTFKYLPFSSSQTW